jgi:hypothetical protein
MAGSAPVPGSTSCKSSRTSYQRLRHAREGGHPGPMLWMPPWARACEAVIQSRTPVPCDPSVIPAKAGIQEFPSLAPGSPLSRGRRICLSAEFSDSLLRGSDEIAFFQLPRRLIARAIGTKSALLPGRVAILEPSTAAREVVSRTAPVPRYRHPVGRALPCVALPGAEWRRRQSRERPGER